MRLFWLSFCDDTDGHFLGVCIVEADDWDMAVRTAWKKGCNPGGNVQIVQWPKGKPVADAKWFNRLLTKADIASLEAELEAT